MSVCACPCVCVCACVCEGKVCARLKCVHGEIVCEEKLCGGEKCVRGGKMCASACGKQIVGLWKTNC